MYNQKTEINPKLVYLGECAFEGVRGHGLQRGGGGPRPRQPEGHQDVRQARPNIQGRIRSFQVFIYAFLILKKYK